MEPRQLLSLMDKIIRELDDLKNSQKSVLKKIAQIEADNINLGAEVLNNDLAEIHEKADDGLEKVSVLQEQFVEFRNNYEKDNKRFMVDTNSL